MRCRDLTVSVSGVDILSQPLTDSLIMEDRRLVPVVFGFLPAVPRPDHKSSPMQTCQACPGQCPTTVKTSRTPAGPWAAIIVLLRVITSPVLL